MQHTAVILTSRLVYSLGTRRLIQTMCLRRTPQGSSAWPPRFSRTTRGHACQSLWTFQMFDAIRTDRARRALSAYFPSFRCTASPAQSSTGRRPSTHRMQPASAAPPVSPARRQRQTLACARHVLWVEQESPELVHHATDLVQQQMQHRLRASSARLAANPATTVQFVLRAGALRYRPSVSRAMRAPPGTCQPLRALSVNNAQLGRPRMAYRTRASAMQAGTTGASA